MVFGLLIRDLGYELRGACPEEPDLQLLKQELLLAAENQCDISRFSSLRETWDRWFCPSVFPSGEATWESYNRTCEMVAKRTFKDVYQIASYSLKIKTRNKNRAHEKEYIEKLSANEESCHKWAVDRSNPISRIAHGIFRTITGSLDLSPKAIGPYMRHGPGAVLEGEVRSDKNVLNDPAIDMQKSYGYECFLANANMLSDYARLFPYSRADRHVHARLTLVPKDWKGVRGVFVSSKEAMMVQLAQDKALRLCFENSALKHCIDFDDQEPSRALAHLSSYDGSHATLDLSDASDRIPLSLVSFLCHRSDYIRLARTRPSYVELPNGSRRKVRMFSPMGDGKTFSVLSAVCATIVIATLLDADGWLPSQYVDCSTLNEYAKKIRVFGDDIIVPAAYYSAVCYGLQIHNLKVNLSKSFVSGYFRESCGLDAYHGTDVTPFRQRVDLNDIRLEDLQSMIDGFNRLSRFYPHLVRVRLYYESLIHSLGWPIGITTNPNRCPSCLMVNDASRLMYRAFLAVSRIHAKHVERIPRKGEYVPQAYRGNSPKMSRPVRVPIRFNDALQRLEQYCYVGCDEKDLITSLDPWWDLNYWLITSSRPTDSKESAVPFTRHSSTVFPRSNDATRRYLRLLDEAGLPRRHIDKIRSKSYLGWVELI